MSTTRLVLWRHGVTDWNERGILQGQTDVPLNRHGLDQAKAVAPHLAAMGPVALYCSPMLRARQTAAALVGLTGLDVQLDQRLAEIDVGTWMGMAVADMAASDPEVRRAMRDGLDYRRSPTGETMSEVGRRVRDCLEDVAEAHKGQTVVLVSHGGAIRMGMATMLGWTYDMSLGLGGMVNCGWSVLGFSHWRWRIECYNNSAIPARPGANAEV